MSRTPLPRLLLAGVGVCLAGGLGLGLAGCGSSGSDGGAASTPSSDGTAGDVKDLDGGTFTSVSVTGHDLVAGTRMRLVFDAGRLAASAGCNTMSAPYAVTGSRLAWTGDPVSTTLGCDAAKTAQDEWLGRLLSDGAELSRSGGDEVLGLSADLVVVELLRGTPTEASVLLGTTWTVTGFSDGTTASTVPEGLTKPTVRIGKDGAVVVDTGCNAGRSTATASGSTLTLGPLALTRKGCADDRAVAVEAAVVQVLDGAVQVSVEGRTATFTKGGRSLTLTSAG